MELVLLTYKHLIKLPFTEDLSLLIVFLYMTSAPDRLSALVEGEPEKAPTNSILILYISTWERSDLFLATLCASKLATWRRKEGCDFNGDGYADILGHKANDERLLRNNPILQAGWEHAWWAKPEIGPLLEILALLATYQIDQGSHVIYRESNPVRLNPRLTQISDGKSKSVQVTYRDKSHFPNAIQGGTGSYPSLPATFENEFVSQVVTSYGGGITETRNYDYTDMRFRMGRPTDRAHYGARIQTTTHGETGIRVESTQAQNARLIAAQPIQNRIYTSEGQLVQQSQVTYATPVLASGLRTAHPVSQTETKYRTGQVVTEKTVTIQYDSYGFPTITTEKTCPPSSVPCPLKVTTNTYNHNTTPTQWRLGQATRTSKTAGGVLVEDTEYTYDTKGNVITQKQFPGTIYQTTTTLSYDSYGNPISITDGAGRTTTIEYETTLYKYPTKITNPLGHVQTKEIDTATGLETAEIDPNGVITRKYYDGFGRLSGETFPGSSNLDKRYVYAIEDGTGSTAVKVITNDPIHGNISKTEIFDAKGRPKKIETLLPGNVKMVELTEYDSLGRVHRKSAPFVEGLGPIPWTTTEYNPEGEITKLIQPDGTTIQNTYSGLTTTSQMYGPSGSLLQTTSLTTDAEENPISRTSNGLTLTYEYDNAGRNTRITDPEGVATVLEYDLAGRRTKQVDKTSGETIFQYNAKGNLTKQTDARGMYITFEYDELDRITKLTPSDGTPPTTYHYDQPTIQSTQALGKLTKITGEFGTIELGYDNKGAENYRVHTIDDIKAYLKTETDSHGRLTSRTLPDGTKLRYDYAPSGHMVRVAMDTSDGNSINHTVAQYAGPIVEGDKFYLERKTGNNVSTKIEFDPLRRRPIAMKTTLAEGQTAQHLRYSYDEKGNILEIKDFLREDKNQTFEYDTHNRITKAIGKYGTEEYEYTAGGNLRKRGQFTLSYDDPNHKHAVTRATSPNTGVFHYSYDATGNMVSRNGDTLIYDANRKLKEMIKSDGIKYRYKYDQNGLRVKKTSLETGEIVYSLFDGMYDIARRPSKPEAHTVYIRGIKDDLLAQITREDASLLISDKSESLNADRLALSSGILKSISICKDKSVDCGSYLKNASKFYLNKYIVDGLYHSKYKNLRMIVGWGIVLGLLYWLVYSQLSNGSISFGNIYRFVSPLLLTSILFTFTSGCGIFTTGGGQGDAPWLLLGSGINNDTPSVRDDGMVVSGGGGGIPFTVPVTGMYFVHSDHLGSVSFLTNGRGAIVAGGEFGGKSDIQYKPYGEIDRPHSSGPDISKYKYTGQEEDKESGLLYYKARYYDPGLGRFLQADSMVFPEKMSGLNRFMYVDGNPISGIDPTGHFKERSRSQSIIKSLLVAKMAYNFLKGEEDYGFSNLPDIFQKFIIFRYGGSIVREVSRAFRHIVKTIDTAVKSVAKGITGTLRQVGRSIDHSLKGIARGITGTARQIGRAMDGGARWLASGGSYSRNKGNDLDRAFGTNFFRDIERSDAGRLVTDAWQGLRRANWTMIIGGILSMAAGYFLMALGTVISATIIGIPLGLVVIGFGTILFTSGIEMIAVGLTRIEPDKSGSYSNSEVGGGFQLWPLQ